MYCDESQSTEECFEAVAEWMLGEKHTHTLCATVHLSPRWELAMWSSWCHPLVTSLSTFPSVCFCTCLCDRLVLLQRLYLDCGVCILLLLCEWKVWLFFFSSTVLVAENINRDCHRHNPTCPHCGDQESHQAYKTISRVIILPKCRLPSWSVNTGCISRHVWSVK